MLQVLGMSSLCVPVRSAARRPSMRLSKRNTAPRSPALVIEVSADQQALLQNIFEIVNPAGFVLASFTPVNIIGAGVSLKMEGQGVTGRGLTLVPDNSTGAAFLNTAIVAGLIVDSIVGINNSGTVQHYNNGGILCGRNAATPFLLSHGAYFSDLAARPVTLTAADAWASATTNKAGGAFSVAAGGGGNTDAVGGALTLSGGKGTGSGAGGTVKIQVAPAGTTGTSQNAWVDIITVTSNGLVSYPTTVTTTGTTGNQTINKLTGTVNIAAAGTTVTVTNSLVSANSLVFVVLRKNDSTATVKNVVPEAGSFVINLGAAATAEVSLGFLVVN